MSKTTPKASNKIAPKAMPKQQFPAYLAQWIARAGSQTALARELGLAQSQLSRVMLGKDDPTPKLLAKVGLKREIRYVPLEREDGR